MHTQESLLPHGLSRAVTSLPHSRTPGKSLILLMCVSQQRFPLGTQVSLTLICTTDGQARAKAHVAAELAKWLHAHTGQGMQVHGPLQATSSLSAGASRHAVRTWRHMVDVWLATSSL